MATIGESVAVLHVKDAKLEDVGESFEPTHITVTYNTKYISVVEVFTVILILKADIILYILK